MRGRIWARFHTHRTSAAPLAERLQEAWDRHSKENEQSVDYDGVDEANILNRFLYRNAEHPAILPIDRTGAEIDWNAVARRALAIDDEALVFDVKLVSEEERPVDVLMEGERDSTGVRAASVAT